MLINDILQQYNDELAKAMTTEYDFSQNNLVEITFPDAVAIWGGVETPLLMRTNPVRTPAVTVRWRDAQIPAVEENAQITGTLVNTLTGASTIPTLRTNTCQLMMALIEVAGSAAQEARNGVYGADLQNQIDWQVGLKLPQMVGSFAYSCWFGTEVTEESAAEAAARKMSGLIGTVGAGGFDDGLLTTSGRATVTSNSGGAFTEAVFGDWLESIANAGAGANHRPTAVYCSMRAQRYISKNFENVVQVNANLSDLAALTAGQLVTKYVAPWGSIIDIVHEPQCAYSDTAANNWMTALCEPDIKPAMFRGNADTGGIEAQRLPYTPDREQISMLLEGSIIAEVSKAHGVIHNFTISL